MQKSIISPAGVAPAVRPLIEIETEIKAHSQFLTGSIIAIGRALLEAKAQLQHGAWGEWLKTKVQFSQSTANNFMRVAREVDEQSTLAQLPYTKVLALLEVPKAERETFAQKADAESATVAELKSEIRKLKADAEEKQAAQKEADIQRDRAARVEEMYNQLQDKVMELSGELENEKQKRIPDAIIETRIEAPSDYAHLKAQAQALQKRAQDAETYAMQAEERLKEAKREAQKAMMASADNGDMLTDDPLNVDAFEKACRDFLSLMCMAPEMRAYFESKTTAERMRYQGAAQAVKHWAHGTLAVLQDGEAVNIKDGDGHVE